MVRSEEKGEAERRRIMKRRGRGGEEENHNAK
jgi:hypothetical protein